MRLLVTGGTGFIGSHLAEEGRRRGAEVVVLLALAAVVEDVCASLAIDPPIYRRRMDSFHSDSEFDISRAGGCLGGSPR